MGSQADSLIQEANDGVKKKGCGWNQTLEIQKKVALLLDYATSRSSIDIKEEFLTSKVPLLRKKPSELTDEEEAQLWDACNKLTTLVAPATSESLEIANEIKLEREQISQMSEKERERNWPLAIRCKKELRAIKRIMITSLVVLLLIQGYTILLIGAVRNSDGISTDYSRFKQVKRDSSLSSVITDNRTIPKHIDSKLSFSKSETSSTQHQSSDKSYDETQSNVDPKPSTYTNDVESDLKERIRISNSSLYKLLTYFYPTTLVKLDSSSRCENILDIDSIGNNGTDNIEYNYEYFMFVDTLAKSRLEVLSMHILPLLLGILGAVVNIVRNALSKLEKKSFVPGPYGPIAMRLCLGGLLGSITVIMLSPNQQEMASLKLSLNFIAFLMGYSVELAFSLFDAAIEKVKNTLKPETKTLAGS